MQVAADQHRAAAGVAGHIDIGMVEKADLPAKQMDRAAGLSRAGAGRFDRAGHHRGAGFGLNRYLARLPAVGAEAAAGFEGHVLLRAQDDFAVCVPYDLVGIDDAGVPKRRSVNADFPALRKDLAEVDGGVIARRDFDPYPRRAGVENLHRLAGGQDHVALRAGDDATVGDACSDQVDAATRRRGDTALIFHLAGKRIGHEIEPSREKVLVAQVER